MCFSSHISVGEVQGWWWSTGINGSDNYCCNALIWCIIRLLWFLAGGLNDSMADP